MNKENSTTKIDVEIGDFIIVNDLNMGIVDKEMVVTCVDPESHYKKFKGDNCIRADDGHGVTYTLSDSQYKKVEKSNLSNINPTDKIKPIHRDNGTSNQPFYTVVDTGDSRVTFFDDLGNRRSLSRDKVIKVTDDNMLESVQYLSKEFNELKQAFIEVNRLLADDINHNLDKLKR